jgi:20S proteasome alpha/beta subunit
MTLTLALEGAGGLVVAADSRGTIGDPRGLTAINDVQLKLFRLADTCALAVSGASELAARIVDRLNDRLAQESNRPDVEQVLATSIDLMKSEYTSWFGPRPWVTAQQVLDQRPLVAFILAGYRREGVPVPVPRIYLLTSQTDFAPQLASAGSMMAGVPQYATYLMHRLYDRGMGLRSLQALGAYLITETASQDPKVGGPIRMATITADNGYQEVADETIDELIRANEEQSQRLRQFFFDRGVNEGGERDG